jgi:hypothetical protein
MQRAMKPWLYPEPLFAGTTLKRLQTKCLELLHRTTNSVIRTRKLDLTTNNTAKDAEPSQDHVLGNFFCLRVNSWQFRIRRMVSSGLLRRVALVRTWSLLALRRNTNLVFLRSVHRLLVAACVVPSSPIFVTLMKEAPGSSETSVLTRATWRNNPEDTIIHSHRRENLKSYNSE